MTAKPKWIKYECEGCEWKLYDRSIECSSCYIYSSTAKYQMSIEMEKDGYIPKTRSKI